MMSFWSAHVVGIETVAVSLGNLSEADAVGHALTVNEASVAGVMAWKFSGAVVAGQ
jgi:hypothetical protein